MDHDLETNQMFDFIQLDEENIDSSQTYPFQHVVVYNGVDMFIRINGRH